MTKPPVYTKNHSQPKSSKNPYHRLREASASANPGVEPQMPQLPDRVARNKTPVRAVFDDLATAHSSITSGSARSTHRSPPNKFAENSIPLQEFKPARRSDQTAFNHLPLPPLPVVISGPDPSQCPDRYLGACYEEVNPGHHAKNESGIASSVQDQQMSTAAKEQEQKYIASVPPLGIGESSRIQSLWPRDSQDKRHRFAHRIKESRKESSNTHYFADKSSLGAPVAGSLPTSKLEHHSEEGSTELRNFNDIENDDGYSLLHEGIRYQDSQMESATESQETGPNRQAPLTGSNEASSFPDSSTTIGNIYKSYVRSDEFNLANSEGDRDSENALATKASISLGRRLSCLSSPSYGQDKPSALDLRKQRRAERLVGNPPGNPPISPLPEAPSVEVQFLVPSASEGGMPYSSSYGDTRNLLEITQRTQLTEKVSLGRSIGRCGLQSDQSESELEDESDPQAVKHLGNNNPFHDKTLPQVIISHANDDHCVYDEVPVYPFSAGNRLPLEREVSEALRRVSGYSNYSNGSVSSSILERFAEFQSESSNSVAMGLLRNLDLEDTPPLGNVKNEEGAAATATEAQTFYAQGAIAPNWLHRYGRNVVRVPINHNGAFPDSPPHSSSDNLSEPLGHQGPGTENEREDDINDWETVGESALGTEFRSNKNIFVLHGGTIHRAGSSIANNSDDGTDVTVNTHLPVINEYGSTERIAQHPANIQYFGDYHQRDLKRTNIPVFLPIFREHKVNGYLADSMRTCPPSNPFRNQPKPLARSHTNPFKSPPPEVMTTHGIKNKPAVSRNSSSHNPYRFRSSEDPNTIENSCITGGNIEVTPQTTTIPKVHRSFNWMDDFGDPGPAISRQIETLNNPQPTMILANGAGTHDYNLNCLRIDDRGVNPYYAEHKDADRLQTQEQADTHGSGETPTHHGKNGLSQHRDRTPLIKGPPGAFYQGIRSRPDTRRTGASQEHEELAKLPLRQNCAKSYPTNGLRPLSLLSAYRPTTPTRRDAIEDIRPDNFVYRSPLAPPKSKSWQMLYTGSQLRGIRDAAKADGIFEAPTSTRKHLFESPRLFKWTRESSARTDLARRKQNISIIVLCLCNLFPPMLLLYAIGRMDGIIVWLTDGGVSTFGKGQKRCAYLLLACWAFVTFVGLLTLLVYNLVH